jgi:hypothetical protein
MHPLLFPLWAGGLLWLFLGRDGRRYRVLGWTFLVVLATLILLKAKNYYVTPVYPMLFAAGAVGLELVTRGKQVGSWIRAAYVVMVVAGGIALAPYSLPILSPDSFIRYQARLHLQPPEIEHQNNGPLPQWFADEFGWPEMVEKVAQVYNSLPPEERARTAIFSNSWGEAAAVDFYGPKYGLPKAISKHNSYWLWGPGTYDGSTMIVLRSDGSGDREHFQTVEAAGRVEHPLSRRDEYFTIWLCRGPKFNLQQVWSSMKTYD